MTSNSLLAALALSAAAVVVPSAVPAASATPASGTTQQSKAEQPARTTLEKGIVVECTSGAKRLQAFVTMYENSRYPNVLQVVVGDPDQGLGASFESPQRFVRAGQASGSVEIGGEVATVTGSVVRQGPKSRVREEFDDAGQLIVTRGWHRRLATDLTLSYGDVAVPLTCDNAFAYHLHVTKTPVGG